MHSQRPTPSSW